MYRILICEDDPVILSAMSSYLSSWGYEVRCVKNFKDVMTEFGEFAPELVLLDISLPFIGARKYARSQMCPLYSYRAYRIT